MLILWVKKPFPSLSWMPAKDVIESWIEFYVVLVQVLVKFFSTQNLGNPNQLVIVVVSVKEGFFPKEHGSQHASQRPHVEGIVVHLVVDEEFGSLEVSAGNSHIVLLTRMIELCESPVNETKRTLFVINHHIVRFDISMHDSLRMTVVECLQQLVQIKANVKVRESLIQRLELCVVDILENQGRSPRNWILDNCLQSNDVGSSGQVLQDFDLSFDFLLFDRLEDLDHAFTAWWWWVVTNGGSRLWWLVTGCCSCILESFKDFGILAPS